MITDQHVLVTGGTGSLGKALLTRLTNYSPKQVTILSRDETKQGLLRGKYPEYKFILGDVAKQNDLRRAMRGVDIVFHFAAYKQVPSAQNNVPATIETNIVGSQNVVDIALEMGIKQVVASSTDKSCSPANAYGASKYLMECIFQDGNKYPGTTFHLARYGNVVASNGSVIPLFQRQAAGGGPLTITLPEMTRFWITLDQAVDLLLKALVTDPGVVVVPKAPAMSMQQLAELIGRGLPIRTIGIRPGEKVHESMVSEPESYHTLEEEKHFLIYPPTSGVYNSNAPFTYSSDKAPVLSETEMLAMIEAYS